MSKKFVKLAPYELNMGEYVVGFPEQDLYFEVEDDILMVLNHLKNEDELKDRDDLISNYPKLDLDDFFEQLEDLGVLTYVDSNLKETEKGLNYLKRDNHVNVTYFISALILIFNIAFLFFHFKEVFIIDFQSYRDPIIVFISMFFLETLLAYIHEWGHFITARLVGVESKIRVSQRFIIFLVFECKMNGTWLLDKKLRTFPMLGGIMMDNLIIFITSVFLTLSSVYNPVLYTVLFIQYTKMIYHLIIPFKTDLYYLLLFYFHNSTLEKRVLKSSMIFGYLLLVPLVLIYLLQLFNLVRYIIAEKTIFHLIVTSFIFLIPIIIALYERKKV